MKLPIIGYATQDYVSHVRASKAYRLLLSEYCKVVTSIQARDQFPAFAFVILHVEPHNYMEIYDAYPELHRSYVVSYCVWEADRLPASYQASLARVQEVWTCSEYCKAVIERHHGRVYCIPHVVERDFRYSYADMRKVKRLIDFREDDFLFLNISAVGDKRKNIDDLIGAFRACASQMPEARLILKAPLAIPPSSDRRITIIREHLLDSEINALYTLCHAYVSPHHGEGWGFALSDAMLLGKPTIATNYSGNLQFMSEHNSFLIPAEEKHIRHEHCFGAFSEEMKWAYPRIDEIASTLLLVSRSYGSPALISKVCRAQHDMMRFNKTGVREIIRQRVNELVC